MKRGLILFFGILLFFSLINCVVAQSLDVDPNDPLGVGIGIDELPRNEKEAKDVGENFLMQEWKDLLKRDTFFGSIIFLYEKTTYFLNPVFKIILGVEASLSWIFILTLVIWFTLLIFVIRTFSAFSLFSPWAQDVISLALMIIVSVSGVTHGLASWIIFVLNKLDTWYFKLIGFMIVVILLIVLAVFSKYWKMLIISMREHKAKVEEKSDRAVLHAGADAAGKVYG